MSRKQNIVFTVISALLVLGAIGYVLIASDFFLKIITNIIKLILNLI